MMVNIVVPAMKKNRVCRLVMLTSMLQCDESAQSVHSRTQIRDHIPPNAQTRIREKLLIPIHVA